MRYVRTAEKMYTEIINYIIDHPNCNTARIQQTVNLNARFLNATLLSMRLNRLIVIKHIKSLRKGARLITITRKGVETIYTKKRERK